jgi:hypothetical protein
LLSKRTVKVKRNSDESHVGGADLHSKNGDAIPLPQQSSDSSGGGTIREAAFRAPKLPPAIPVSVVVVLKTATVLLSAACPISASETLIGPLDFGVDDAVATPTDV